MGNFVEAVLEQVSGLSGHQQGSTTSSKREEKISRGVGERAQKRLTYSLPLTKPKPTPYIHPLKIHKPLIITIALLLVLLLSSVAVEQTIDLARY